MTSDTAVRLLEIARRKTDELFSEAIAELERAGGGASDAAERWSRDDPVRLASAPGAGASPLEGPTPTGDWDEIDRSPGQSYKWPDGNEDHYDVLVRYRGHGDFDGLRLALGYRSDGDVVGFVLGSGGGSKRGITYFFPADDFRETNEKVSMIRGGGPRGRSGFAPHEPIPPAYRDLAVDVLGDRKAGKWNVQAVVADAEDHDTMLLHTALQARLRGLW